MRTMMLKLNFDRRPGAGDDRDAGIAGRLLDLADLARSLPPPDRRDPEAFHQAKSDLAAKMRALAWRISRTAGH